ncbi:hypothetical protein [Nocardia sp. NPDC059239]|uniref:hypothetical protein n=1 Tax=Nocardia sp. NPDC059239 TaxID=3346785 RepID=UPI0036BC818D
MSELGYAIVRSDVAGNATATHIAEIRDLAGDLGMSLVAFANLPDDTSYRQLLESFESSGITTVVVPTSAALHGWMFAFRRKVDVQTVFPRRRWPRRWAGASPASTD